MKLFQLILTSILALYLGLSEASAATPTCQGLPPSTPVINATSITFLASPDQLYVSAYRIGVFVKGVTPTDTSSITKQDVSKSLFLDVPNEPGCLTLTLTPILLGTPIQAITEYVMAVKVIVENTAPFDTFESSWSGVSNSFLKSGAIPRPIPSAPKLAK